MAAPKTGRADNNNRVFTVFLPSFFFSFSSMGVVASDGTRLYTLPKRDTDTTVRRNEIQVGFSMSLCLFFFSLTSLDAIFFFIRSYRISTVPSKLSSEFDLVLRLGF